jgi:hypothetical protein
LSRPTPTLLARPFLVVTLPLVWIVAASPLPAQAPAKKAEIVKPTPDERKAVSAAAIEVDRTFLLPGFQDGNWKQLPHVDLMADFMIFSQAAVLMDEYADKGDARMLLDLINVGQDRANSAFENKFPWATEVGAIVRGYVSKLTGARFRGRLGGSMRS